MFPYKVNRVAMELFFLRRLARALGGAVGRWGPSWNPGLCPWLEGAIHDSQVSTGRSVVGLQAASQALRSLQA